MYTNIIVEISISVSPTVNSINSIFHSDTVLHLSDLFKIVRRIYIRGFVAKTDVRMIYLQNRRAISSAKLQWRNISIWSERIIGQRADITMQIRGDTITK